MPNFEAGVVRDEAAVACKRLKGGERLTGGGRAFEHLGGDACQLGDLGRDDLAVGHEGLKTFGDPAVLQAHRADLDDLAALRLEACGLNIEGDKAAAHLTLLGIGQQVAFHAEQCLHTRLCGRLGRLGKGLHDPVIRDGQRLMTPALCRQEGLCQVGDAVLVGHFAVQMQLHALLRRVVHAVFAVDHVDVICGEGQLSRLLEQVNAAAHQQPLVLLLDDAEPVAEALRLPLLRKADGAVDGTLLVRQVEANAPALFALVKLVAPALLELLRYDAPLYDGLLVVLVERLNGFAAVRPDGHACDRSVFGQLRLDDGLARRNRRTGCACGGSSCAYGNRRGLLALAVRKRHLYHGQQLPYRALPQRQRLLVERGRLDGLDL